MFSHNHNQATQQGFTNFSTATKTATSQHHVAKRSSESDYLAANRYKQQHQQQDASDVSLSHSNMACFDTPQQNNFQPPMNTCNVSILKGRNQGIDVICSPSLMSASRGNASVKISQQYQLTSPLFSQNQQQKEQHFSHSQTAAITNSQHFNHHHHHHIDSENIPQPHIISFIDRSLKFTQHLSKTEFLKHKSLTPSLPLVSSSSASKVPIPPSAAASSSQTVERKAYPGAAQSPFKYQSKSSNSKESSSSQSTFSHINLNGSQNANTIEARYLTPSNKQNLPCSSSSSTQPQSLTIGQSPAEHKVGIGRSSQKPSRDIILNTYTQRYSNGQQQSAQPWENYRGADQKSHILPQQPLGEQLPNSSGSSTKVVSNSFHFEAPMQQPSSLKVLVNPPSLPFHIGGNSHLSTRMTVSTRSITPLRGGGGNQPSSTPSQAAMTMTPSTTADHRSWAQQCQFSPKFNISNPSELTQLVQQSSQTPRNGNIKFSQTGSSYYTPQQQQPQQLNMSAVQFLDQHSQHVFNCANDRDQSRFDYNLSHSNLSREISTFSTPLKANVLPLSKQVSQPVPTTGQQHQQLLYTKSSAGTSSISLFDRSPRADGATSSTPIKIDHNDSSSSPSSYHHNLVDSPRFLQEHSHLAVDSTPVKYREQQSLITQQHKSSPATGQMITPSTMQSSATGVGRHFYPSGEYNASHAAAATMTTPKLSHQRNLNLNPTSTATTSIAVNNGSLSLSSLVSFASLKRKRNEQKDETTAITATALAVANNEKQQLAVSRIRFDSINGCGSSRRGGGGGFQASATPSAVSIGNQIPRIPLPDRSRSPQPVQQQNFFATNERERSAGRSPAPVSRANTGTAVASPLNGKQSSNVPPSHGKREPHPIDLSKALEKFIIGKVLGKDPWFYHAMKTDCFVGYGSYAVVRLVTDVQTSVQYAMKTYEKKKLQDPQKKKNVAREVKILSRIKHANIVRLYDVIETTTQLHLVMEFPTSTPLDAHIRAQSGKKLSEDEARVIFAQIVEAVRYCHRKSVVHRDIKLENVLYDAATQRVKLIDFGFAIALAPDTKLNVFCGTPSYMAPEIVNKKDYTFPVDIWALGILLFKTLTGTFPFRGHDDKELFRRINSAKLELTANISLQARSLLTKILTASQADRYTAEQILTDDWFKMKPDLGEELRGV